MGQPKKHRNTSRTKTSSRNQQRLIITVIALLIVGGAAMLLLSGAPTEHTPEVVGAPRVAFAQEQVDFGDVPISQMVEAVFHVSNVGDQTLHFLEEPVIEVREGCCPPRAIVSSTRVAPGGEATITVQFTMHEGMGGPHDFRVHVRTNDPQEPYKELVILSNWI